MPLSSSILADSSYSSLFDIVIFCAPSSGLVEMW